MKRRAKKMRCEPVVKVEEALGGIHAQAGGHVLVIGQRGAEADQTHVLLGQLHVADGSGHQRLQDGPTVVMQQVDFILQNETCSATRCIVTSRHDSKTSLGIVFPIERQTHNDDEAH